MRALKFRTGTFHRFGREKISREKSFSYTLKPLSFLLFLSQSADKASLSMCRGKVILVFSPPQSTVKEKMSRFIPFSQQQSTLGANPGTLCFLSSAMRLIHLSRSEEHTSELQSR